ncbi:putative aBC transporter ATP-binding protein [Mycobacterium xenopi 4042]|uniref:Putative aBC transporter ATP-binding protein n=1 Tax=Mycobacterium xenopi 4042 TaxID=1299334 RepID=X7YR08_MYCXE|nr:putative aBC transporter ATP-binding protein [Mycobacterium xenopi 4042]
MTTLEIKDLHVSVADPSDTEREIPILNGVDLTVSSGETHALMGPTAQASRHCPTPLPGTRSTR